jgi:hypothetical protein
VSEAPEDVVAKFGADQSNGCAELPWAGSGYLLGDAFWSRRFGHDQVEAQAVNVVQRTIQMKDQHLRHHANGMI